MRTFRVKLWGTVAVSAEVIVDAQDECHAKDVAEGKWREAEWVSPNSSHPMADTVEVGDVTEVA